MVVETMGEADVAGYVNQPQDKDMVISWWRLCFTPVYMHEIAKAPINQLTRNFGSYINLFEENLLFVKENQLAIDCEKSSK